MNKELMNNVFLFFSQMVSHYALSESL